MILEKEQINRYIRQIIIPEISGSGQKKLLESTVYVYGESAEQISVLLYYLAACGIGNICCTFKDSSGCESLFDSIRDLNDDISIYLIDTPYPADKTIQDTNDVKNRLLRIFIGKPDTVNNDFINAVEQDNFIPTIIGIINGWQGIIRVFKNHDSLSRFIEKFSKDYILQKPDSDDNDEIYPGSMLSTYLLSCVACIECIKFFLDLGVCLESILYCDLLHMDFNKSKQEKDVDSFINLLISTKKLQTSSALSPRKKLSECSALIVGTGGLGSPAAYALSKAGVGRIGLVDYDKVEISNLNRQILHSISRIGQLKVKSAEIFLEKLNPYVKLFTYDIPFTKENALDIIRDYDIVIDGVDNFETRYLINDACYFGKKTMIEAGVLRFDGLCMSIIPEKSPCYRCIFPIIPEPGTYPSCSESGILGPVPGVLGFIEASETVKELLGIGRSLENRMLLFDGLETDFRVCNLNKSENCPLCGQNPSITELGTYAFTC